MCVGERGVFGCNILAQKSEMCTVQIDVLEKYFLIEVVINNKIAFLLFVTSAVLESSLVSSWGLSF